jgi:hypothetical protein
LLFLLLFLLLLMACFEIDNFFFSLKICSSLCFSPLHFKINFSSWNVSKIRQE